MDASIAMVQALTGPAIAALLALGWGLWSEWGLMAALALDATRFCL